MKDQPELAALREEIADLDRALVELLEHRFRLAARVGELKAAAQEPVVVRQVEQRVLGRARDAASLCGVSGEVMEAIFAAIIRGSVERQHRVGVRMGSRGGARVLVVGAGGSMGGWLRGFLEGIGHETHGVDTAWRGLPAETGRFHSLEAVPELEAYDAVIVSVALEKTPDVLDELGRRKPSVPVLEIASIKSHLEAPLRRLVDEGVEALSIHPMFGPSKNPYEPLTVVHAVLGNEAAERERILTLLRHPYLDLVSMPFERHDRLMGWLLGLAHLTWMVFAEALGRSGLDPAELGRSASTTFRRQVETARSVLLHDPGLYFAIQRLNPHRGAVYAAFTSALGELTGAVEREDREGFREALERAGGVLDMGGALRG